MIPNPGIIIMYTSGCPKNQNKCWYNTGSPPPAGSKKLVLKLRSVKSIVIAPANTGKENNNKNAVINIAQTNRGILCINIPGHLIFKTVTIKLIAPKIEATPAKCKLKIAKSTEGPECDCKLDNGGYTVQPVPAPVSTKLDANNKIKDGGINQKLMLFKRGNAISGAPIKIGTNQFPKPPIKIGITTKNTIINACAVTKTL